MLRWVLPATLLITAAAIGYEILLMRLLSIVQWHHFAYMVISLALLGYGASGTVIALGRPFFERHFITVWSVSALLFAIAMVASFALGQRVPFNALAVVWDPRQFLYLGALYLVFFVPFFFAASCVGLAFTCVSSHIRLIYFLDLLGAGLGAAAIIGSLFVLTPQGALTVLAALALAAAALVGFASPHVYRLIALQLTCLAVLLFGLPQGLHEFRLSPYKGLSQTLQTVDTRVLGEYSSPLGLLTVVESPTVPFRFAPGLSLNAQVSPPEQLALFTDGDAMSAITRFDGDFKPLGFMDDVTAALPYQLLMHPRVLILGAGGGTDVLMALYHGAAKVDAVELNPQTVHLLDSTYAGFTGHIYDDARVTVHVAEARGFVARNRQRYDLIQVSLVDSFAAAGSGVQSLSESYLYTVEALQVYLRHLAPGGVLAITRWLEFPPRDSLKLVATAAEALRRSGVARPGNRIVMIRSWNTGTLLVAPDEFASERIDTIRSFASSRSFDTVYYPSMPPAEANRFNLLPEPWLYNGAVQLLGDHSDAYIERYKFEITPATDDKPYFFHYFKWESFQELMALRTQGGAGLLEWGYLILLGTLVQAVLAGAVLILVPLTVIRSNWPRGTGRRMGGYFFLLGLAFMFVEMAFIQKFILFLSHPLYSVAVVLSGFLVFAGIGSACSERFKQRAAARERSSITIAVAAIVAIALVYVLLLPHVFARFIGLADGVRIAVSLLLIAPLAFFMGMPFPTGLSRIAVDAHNFIPWAWAINGFASVISTSMATLLAIEFGFTIVILFALCLYTAAALVIPGSRSQ